MRVLVTAGPTREAIDPVRFISNQSSGRMGYEIARALLRRGHQVVLVSGPTALRPPKGAEVVEVQSAREMLKECRKVWPKCGAMFAVAAVADHRPARVSRSKLKREQGQGNSIELLANPDIVKTLAKLARPEQRLIGFALESGGLRAKAEAKRKMLEKGLDFVALNGIAAQGSESSRLLLLGADGSEQIIGPDFKPRLATKVVAATISSVN